MAAGSTLLNLLIDNNPYKKLEEQGLAEIRIVNSVGAERFAEMAWHKMTEILIQQVEDNSSLNPTVKVKSVECFEHGANSAIFEM